ncbi:MAG: hypothetical protein Tsb0013_11980 [Phycisphaerales bacterium]
MGDEKKPDPKKKDAPKKPQTFRESVSTMPAWKKTALIAAGVVMAVCLSLQIMASNTRPENVPSAREASQATTRAFQPNSLVATNPDDPNAPATTQGEGAPDSPSAAEQLSEADPMDVYSLGVLRLSFSFFAGLAVAHFLRTLLKATLIGAGFLIFGLLLLQYAGFVDVKWDVIEQRYETFGAWAGDQFESFRTFVTGYLPSVGAATVGGVLGFKRR